MKARNACSASHHVSFFLRHSVRARSTSAFRISITCLISSRSRRKCGMSCVCSSACCRTACSEAWVTSRCAASASNRWLLDAMVVSTLSASLFHAFIFIFIFIFVGVVGVVGVGPPPPPPRDVMTPERFSITPRDLRSSRICCMTRFSSGSSNVSWAIRDSRRVISFSISATEE